MNELISCLRPDALNFCRRRSMKKQPAIDAVPSIPGLMKSTFSLRSFLALSGSSLLTISSVNAATLYWDGTTTIPSFTDVPSVYSLS
jgi:hypothetical protein